MTKKSFWNQPEGQTQSDAPDRPRLDHRHPSLGSIFEPIWCCTKRLRCPASQRISFSLLGIPPSFCPLTAVVRTHVSFH